MIKYFFIASIIPFALGFPMGVAIGWETEKSWVKAILYGIVLFLMLEVVMLFGGCR